MPKIPSMRVTDLARAMAPEAKIDVIGIRPGEKLHEVLISEDEARTTIELDECYVVLPPEALWFGQENGKYPTLKDDFRYASNTNDEWLSMEQIQEMIAPVERVFPMGAQSEPIFGYRGKRIAGSQSGFEACGKTPGHRCDPPAGAGGNPV